MPIVVIFLVVAGALGVAVLYPHLRWIALGVLAFFVLLFGFYFINTNRAPDLASLSVPVEDLTLDHLDLIRAPRFSTLSGTVQNGSETLHLRHMELRLTLLDCPSLEADPADCAVIAENTALARVDVPAGQTRRFDALFTFTNMPDIIGTLVWKHTVIATRASN